MVSLEKRMSFLHHIEELRECIIKIFITVSIFFVFFFSFKLKRGQHFGFNIVYPYPDITNNISSKVFERIKNDLLSNTDIELIMVRPIDAMMTNLKISLFLSIIIGMPMIIYQVWKFFVPALRYNEKNN